MARRLSRLLPLLALTILGGCGYVSQQRILQARVSIPSPPPLPTLPMVHGQEMTFQLGVSSRTGTPPRGGVVDDSVGLPLGIDAASWYPGAGIGLRWKILRLSLDASLTDVSAVGGLDLSNSWLGVLLYAGTGYGPHTDSLVLRQRWVDYPHDVRDTTITVTGKEWGSYRLFGGSVALGPSFLQAFVSGRYKAGLQVDGEALSGSGHPASNLIRLDERSLDFGLRSTFPNNLSVIAGCGPRQFLDKRIRGTDWRAFVGLSYAFGLEKPAVKDDDEY